MRILFIFPPQQVCKAASTENVCRQNSREGAILPPLGIAYLAAIMEEEHHQVKIIDANALRLTVKEVIEEARTFNPGIISFSLVTPNFHVDLEWIRVVKSACKATVIVGGPHVTFYPRQTLTFKEIDFCVVGEGWESMPELINCLENGNDPNGVKGIAFRKGDEFIITRGREGKIDIDSAPWPARHLLPNHKYTTILSKRYPSTVMMSSSGCPFECTYCLHDKKVVFRDPVRVVDEMEECRGRFKIKEINFYDEIFSLNKQRAVLICEEIIRREMDLVWTIRTRPDCVDRELIKLFARAGCGRVHYGIESANPEVLKAVKRDIPLSLIRDVVRWTKEERMSVLGFFIIGFPGESRRNILKTVEFAKELNLDYVQINKLVPIPNTGLYDMVVRRDGVDTWMEYALGHKELSSGFAPLDSELSADDLDRWIKKSMRSFYLRPAFIFKTAMGVRSWREFRGLIHSAFALR
jgi:radical SAM superfamily enzyme YgiQ (UPF0313 family)